MEEETHETFVESEPNQLASRGKRLAAAVVDVFIFFPLVLLVAQPLGLINISDPANMQGLNLEQSIKLFIIGQVLFLLVQGYLLHTQGQTIGKKLLKIRIVSLDDKLRGIGQLYFVRYLTFSLIAQIPIIGALIGIVNVLFIFGQDRRCLHDRLAGTKVIEAT
mgnify:FL=1|tara:strand:- start:948 stop:1436 length:489 start_codon:yes stop_codon:yes gene_type:complete